MTVPITFPLVFFMKASWSSYNIALMTSYMLTVVILLVSLVTNCVDDFFALLNEDGVNNLLASCLGDLARVLMGMLVALLLLFILLLPRISWTFNNSFDFFFSMSSSSRPSLNRRSFSCCSSLSSVMVCSFAAMFSEFGLSEQALIYSDLVVGVLVTRVDK